MLEYALKIAVDYNFDTIIAILLEKNKVSVKLLENYGFKKWGTLPKAVIIGEERFDHLYYGLRLIERDCK